jgi:hypothetical protein
MSTQEPTPAATVTQIAPGATQVSVGAPFKSHVYLIRDQAVIEAHREDVFSPICSTTLPASSGKHPHSRPLSHFQIRFSPSTLRMRPGLHAST